MPEHKEIVRFFYPEADVVQQNNGLHHVARHAAAPGRDGNKMDQDEWLSDRFASEARAWKDAAEHLREHLGQAEQLRAAASRWLTALDGCDNEDCNQGAGPCCDCDETILAAQEQVRTLLRQTKGA